MHNASLININLEYKYKNLLPIPVLYEQILNYQAAVKLSIQK